MARRPVQPVTIQQLLSRSSAKSEAAHVRHAAWIQQELPVRLAHRLADFMMLPHIVVCNAHFNEVFQLFLDSFDTLLQTRQVDDIASARDFAEALHRNVRKHDDIVHSLQEGYGDLQAMLDDLVELDAFLDQTFKTRIGNRVLAEHFLEVHTAWCKGTTEAPCTGVVHPSCRPAEVIEELGGSLGRLCEDLYGIKSRVELSGQVDTSLSFIPDHLHFMLQEILKNAFRATIERHSADPTGVPPVSVEIMKGSFDVTLKVSDCGGGMQRETQQRIWKYGYSSTTALQPSEAVDSGGLFGGICGQDRISFRQLAGYGFGLPLSRVYARYFGGDIILQSMHGYGTDVYLNVNHLGDVGTGEAAKTQRARLAAS